MHGIGRINLEISQRNLGHHKCPALPWACSLQHKTCSVTLLYSEANGSSELAFFEGASSPRKGARAQKGGESTALAERELLG